jgi:hypothetical protein
MTQSCYCAIVTIVVTKAQCKKIQMPNDTVRASATALPVTPVAEISTTGISSRRFFLAAGSAAAVFAGLKGVAHAAASGDAEIVALSAEVLHLNEVADEITATRIEPFEEKFMALLDPQYSARDWDTRAAAAWGYSRECGRCAAIEDVAGVDDQADAAFRRMMAIPSTTQAGRAAKVRALLIHVMRDEWLGPDSDLDWDKSMARTLLGEFAGMSAEELADLIPEL